MLGTPKPAASHVRRTRAQVEREERLRKFRQRRNAGVCIILVIAGGTIVAVLVVNDWPLQSNTIAIAAATVIPLMLRD